MLTIFTTAKPFRGQIKVIQTNAIQSWTLLRPACEIILFGDEEGAAEVAAKQGIRHVIDVERNEYGTPLVGSMFKVAQEIANNKLMCFANADIILMSDFLPAIRLIQYREFLLIGQRWDIDLTEPLDFSNSNWEEQLRARLTNEAKLHAPSGLDYFVFPRGMYHDIPPFAIGRPGWDNWIVYWTRKMRIPVIDATKVITVIHRNHDYSHHPEGKAGVWAGAEAQRNRKLVGGYNRVFNVRDATIVLTAEGIKKISPARIIDRHCKRVARALVSSTLAALRRLG